MCWVFKNTWNYLGNLSDDEGINRASQNIKGNNETSAKEDLSLKNCNRINHGLKKNFYGFIKTSLMQII